MRSLVQSDVCSCGEQMCLEIYIKLFDISVTIFRYSPGIDDLFPGRDFSGVRLLGRSIPRERLD